MAKFSLLVGAAAGYVLGTRAGRGRYEQIKRVSHKAWTSGPVQRQVEGAKHAAKTKLAPAVADAVADAARASATKLRATPRQLRGAVVRRDPTQDTPQDPSAS